MNYDHDAIRKAYPNVTLIDDSVGIFDASGNSVSVAQTAVDAARVELNKLNYRSDRVCLLYTSPSPRDVEESRMPSSA